MTSHPGTFQFYTANSTNPPVSAKSLEAATCLHEEALEKEKQGYAEIVRWDDIKDSPHPNLKISPLAAVLHKSHLFQAILDLTFLLQINDIIFPSMNEATAHFLFMNQWSKRERSCGTWSLPLCMSIPRMALCFFQMGH